MTARVTVDETALQSFTGQPAAPAVSVEELIEVAVERAIRRSLGPHLRHLTAPQPLVYTVAQSARDPSALGGHNRADGEERCPPSGSPRGRQGPHSQAALSTG